MVLTLTSGRTEIAITGSSSDHARGRRDRLVTALRVSIATTANLSRHLSVLSDMADTLYAEMEFGFLFDPNRQLLSIGYQVQDNRLDGGYYDLLASEARLASFVAIAKGDIPAKHWFRMGRTLTPIGHGSVLLSWSGSMFEYLMPALVMRAPPGSLLEQTNRLSVRRQISYGAELGVPWGVSESQYNARDFEFTYQYSGFGVPDLGYKRGLTENIVIAPYATGLAAMVEPGAAARNFKRLSEGRRPGRLWLVRSTRLHARPPAGGRQGRGDPCLYGASSGHVPDWHRGCASGRSDAGAIPRGTDRPGNRAFAAGADAARDPGGAPAEPAPQRCRRYPSALSGDSAQIQFTAFPGSADAPSVEWPLFRHGDGRWRRLQPVARLGRDALA